MLTVEHAPQLVIVTLVTLDILLTKEYASFVLLTVFTAYLLQLARFAVKDII